jgi:hypothetical protein
MVGKSSERDFACRTVAALGKRNAKDSRGGLCIFFEGLVEVTHAEEKNRVRVLCLNLLVLFH